MMSRQLAFAAAFSVLLMAAYVLFDPSTAGSPVHGNGVSIPLEALAPQMPSLWQVLPSLR